MARPYSQDLRNRVVSSVASGRTCRATAALFGVSVASVVKWSQRWRASGSAAAKPMGEQFLVPTLNPVTSSSWTISAATRVKPCAA